MFLLHKSSFYNFLCSNNVKLLLNVKNMSMLFFLLNDIMFKERQNSTVTHTIKKFIIASNIVTHGI